MGIYESGGVGVPPSGIIMYVWVDGPQVCVCGLMESSGGVGV